MEFKDNEAIYLQIAGYLGEHILVGKWAEEQKIPSVRELAVTLEVNPNTVMRAYEFMQNQEVIYNKRGLGFFVSPQGADKVRAFRKARFMEEELPVLFRNMTLVGIGMDEVRAEFEKYISKNNS